MAQILDGKKVAKVIKQKVAADVARYSSKYSMIPALATILVGEDPASQVYIKNKRRSCEECGMRSLHISLPATVEETELLATIRQLNEDPTVHGILVQLPLPKQINSESILDAIDPHKDVDGFHPKNVAALCLNRPALNPCTPSGIMELLNHYDIDIRGKHAVVMGRSHIVGKPMAQLLLNADATVTITHSRTKDTQMITKQADILVVAIGQPEYVDETYVKNGTVVVDVGIHRKGNGTLCGDVAFESVSKVASYISPVPGGVGPLTIAMLMKNTLQAYFGSVPVASRNQY